MTLSKYGRVFNSSCYAWEKNRKFNLLFLKAEQNYFNDVLRNRGFVFLRDIYELLGFPITKESVIVGWVYEKNNPIGDNYIEFSIGDNDDETNPDVKIDFNVDGNILDRIEGLSR